MQTGAVFERLLGPPLATAEVDPRVVPDGLLPEEEPIVSGAAPRRVAHFTAGRVCARRALSVLGAGEDAPILQAEDRAPIWPEGFVGSITHAEEWCAAAVARSVEVRGVGIDLESAAPLKESVVQRICTPVERRRLAATSHPELMAKLFFSAKEAVYKAQHGITHQYLGFHAVELALDVERERFEAIFQRDAGEFRTGDHVSGRYFLGNDLVATACVIGVT